MFILFMLTVLVHNYCPKFLPVIWKLWTKCWDQFFGDSVH